MYKTMQIFKDPQDDAFFKANGYLVRGQLPDAAVAELSALWQEIKPAEVPGRIYSNVYNMADKAKNVLIDQQIKAIFEPIVTEMMVDYYNTAGTFLVKGCGPESSSVPHQDWNNVDETKYISMNIWCPLNDVDSTNGELVVIPGSHTLFPSIRATSRPSVFLPFSDALEPHLVRVPMKAGEMCFYAHNLMHGSKPNNSSEVRVAVVAGLLPKEAQFLHYLSSQDEQGNEQVEILGVDENFYYEHLPSMLAGQRPKALETLGFVQNPPAVLTEADVLEKLQRQHTSATATARQSWFKRIISGIFKS